MIDRNENRPAWLRSQAPDEGKDVRIGGGVSVMGEIARTLEIPNDARVLFNYEDGTPGVYSRRLGQGEVIVFSAMPLSDTGPAYTIGTSGLLGYTGWDTFLAALAKEKNIQTDLPIWRFELPAAVGSQRGTQE